MKFLQINKSGDKFGLLTLIERHHKQSGSWYWKCKCDCGNEYITALKNLRRGVTKSCGCLRPNKMKELIGKEINNIKILELIGRKNCHTWYKCQCVKCGNIIQLSRNQIKIGTKKCKKCDLNNLLGTKKGKLTVLNYEIINKQKYLKVKCDCGGNFKMTYISFIKSIEPHCGCMNKTNHELYSIWSGIKQRCINKKVHNYRDYGGRGITICDRWLNSFDNFVTDMGNRPAGYSIDRINNNGNYEPSNCKWSLDLEQHNNKRKHEDIINNLIRLAYEQGKKQEPLIINYKSKL